MGRLVLSRKRGESIRLTIPKNLPDSEREIEILLVDVGSKKVRIGISASKRIPIVRTELLEEPE